MILASDGPLDKIFTYAPDLRFRSEWPFGDLVIIRMKGPFDKISDTCVNFTYDKYQPLMHHFDNIPAVFKLTESHVRAIVAYLYLLGKVYDTIH